MKMDRLKFAQLLIPKIDFMGALNDKALGSNFGNLVSKMSFSHLRLDHDFVTHKRKAEKVKDQTLPSKFKSHVVKYLKYELKVFTVLYWIIKSRVNPDSASKNEAVILKGLGFQQINPYVSFREIFDSIPSKVFQSRSHNKIYPVLINNIDFDLSASGVSSKSLIQAFLLVLKPNRRRFWIFVFQSQIIAILAAFDSKLINLLDEIPEALLLVNFESCFEHISIIDTQGSFLDLDLFYFVSKKTSCIRTTLIHYSESGMPFVTTQEFYDGIIPSYERARVDTQIVWTQEFADHYINRGARSSFIALGPQVFRERMVVTREKKTNELTLAVFDETPSYHDEFYVHLREEAGLNFLSAISELRENFRSINELKLTILFKQKRRNLELHSQTYLKRLEFMHSQGIINLLPWHTNPYLMISKTDLTLSVLGSSPALIARWLAVPTAYGYFGEGELIQPIIDYGIPILRNSSELSNWILDSFAH
jgi:hypothetical protein